VPVGVLYGTGDRILNPTEHQAALTAKLPLAECELIEGAGHMIPISSADRCAQFIARMAQRVENSGASRPAKALV
jgi:pimeloyl-ACP methyl ester carboxylesterase